MARPAKRSMRELYEMRRLARVEKAKQQVDEYLKSRSLYQELRDEVVLGRLTPEQAMQRLREAGYGA